MAAPGTPQAFLQKGQDMKTNAIALGISLLAGLIAAGSATAQMRAACGDRDTVVNRLSSTYGETVQSMGLGANNGIFEVFASDDTGTWTITVTMPNGRTCLLASGQAFEALQDALPAGGEDA